MMRRSIAIPALVLAAVALSGCANVQQLKRERDVLAAELSVVKDRAVELDARVNSLTDVNRALAVEKEARVQETTEVRSEIRDFVRQQVGAIQKFSRSYRLLDYIGGELVRRKHCDGKGLLLLDMKNRLNADAQLTGGEAYLKGPSKFSFCVLRPFGSDFKVVWTSKEFDEKKPGLVRVAFASPIGAAKGDIIGFYSSSRVQVPYDRGTGDTRRVKKRPRAGDDLPRSSLDGGGARTYSFGVVGFLSHD